MPLVGGGLRGVADAGAQALRHLLGQDEPHHDSAIQLTQIEGRCHRDGEGAAVFYAYGEATVEEAVAATMMRRMVSMEATAGEDATLLDEIAEIIAAAASR